jgi:glycosyltransferase involved in cell wall biosynthesis/Flp pilus assembly protein TadD
MTTAPTPSSAHPLVSIAMGVYNAEAYVTQTVQSILNQDYPYFELLISDNGSQDRSSEICRSFAEKDPRIIYSRNEDNINPCKNAGNMLYRTTGQYHMWAADHDIYHPKYISSLLNVFDNEDESLVLVYPNSCHIDKHNKPIREIEEDIDTRGLSTVRRFQKVLWGISYCTPMYGLYRASALKDVFQLRWIIGPDVVFLPEFSLRGTFAHHEETLFFWRQNRPVEEYFELNDRQAKLLVRNEVEKLAPATIRDYELIKIVENSGLRNREKEELFSEVIKRHQNLPEFKLSREVRYLLHEGFKLFDVQGELNEKAKKTADDFYRVSQIAKIFYKNFEEQLDQLCRLCLPHLDHNPYKPISTAFLNSGREHTAVSSGLERLIPPEIKNDAFYKDIERLSSQEGVSNILEIGSSSGQGSTSAFAAGVKASGNKASVYCMEISEARHRELERRYADNDNVICYQASSVARNRFPSEQQVIDFYRSTPTALNQYPLEQVLGWLRKDKAYLGQSKVQENGIASIKATHGIENFDLVLIDGSEFTGSAELDDVYGAKVIMLDDVNSYKNYDNYHRLKKDPNYRLEKENWQLRNGYAIFRLKEEQVLPIHFFSIVLNGEPFIRHHLERFKQLNIPWHWHIIEGVADLKHDTAWSLSHGGRILGKYHHKGLSVDGTTAYLDRIAQENPDRVTLYRKNDGNFWEGKLEMVNAPLANLPCQCLLWQIDADELWEPEQINTAHQMFEAAPERTAAFFHCHFFVGPDLVTTTTDTYSHNTEYEWIRLWRYKKGMQWKSHEPPRLMQQRDTEWVDLSRVSPFTHRETESSGLVFSHYAYALASQVRFKEDYYGYKGALRQWQMLQEVKTFPVRLSSYFEWVRDDTMVDRIENRTIGSAVPPVKIDDVMATDGKSDTLEAPHIVIDGVIFQLQAGRPQGISRVWSNLIPELTRQFPEARITVLQREGFAVPISNVEMQTIPAYQLGPEAQLDVDDEMLRKVCCDLNADIFLSTYYSRAPGVLNVVMIHDLIPEKFGFDLLQPEWFAKQRAIETGDAFMCVSGVARDDLLRFYPRAMRAGTMIVPNGLDTCFHPEEPVAAVELRRKLGITKDYLLFVGNRQGYKNVAPALKALSESDNSAEFCVLCVGGEKQPSGEELSFNRKLELRYAGQLSDSELAVAYSGARALLVPSRYEGFGLPVIEAMACNCPVIAEKTPAVLEVGGDAVVYADLACTQSIDQALRKVSDPVFRQTIITRGKARAGRFSWAQSASKMMQFIKGLTAQESILLTAVVSTYNAERFIEGCLQDLLEQTIGDRLEIIVVDSASEEDEATVVRDFQKRYPNIKYLRTAMRENVYQAWNRGIKFALGKYVTNANTDDRHRHDAYELMVGELETNDDIALVYADVIKTKTANETFRQCTPTGVSRWHDWDRSKLLEEGCFIGPQPVWRKSVHREYGYFDDNYFVSADFEFWLRISQTHDFYHINKPLGLYMDRPDSIEHAAGTRKEHEDQEILQRYRVAAKRQKQIGISSENHHHRDLEPCPSQQAGSKPCPGSGLDLNSTNEAIPQGGHPMTSPETIIKAIEHLVDNGQNESAIWAMDKLLSDHPDNARLHNEMAALAYEQADMHTALVHFKKAVELEPRNVAFRKSLADYYYVVEKDVENALAQYEDVLNLDPNHIDSLIMAGHLSVSQHRYSQGQQYYQRALDLDPNNTEVRGILEKMNTPAEDHSTVAMSSEGLYAAAVDKVEAGDSATAIALLEQLLAGDDNHALAHNDLGVLHYESGNMEAARAHYEKAAGLQPENDTFQKNLADFYLAVMGDPARALSTYIQVLKLNPQDVEAMLSCGQICMRLGKKDDAKDLIHTALEIEPWNENARKLLLQLDQASGNPEAGDVDLYAGARTKASQGDLPGAIADLNQYVSAAPEDANAHNDLGVLYYESGEKDKAVASYERAVQLAPEDPTYRKNLADIYLMEQGRIQEAMKLYLGVMEENPQDLEGLIGCGMISAAVGQTADAKYFYHRVLEIEPWNEMARQALEEIRVRPDEHSKGFGAAAAG